MARRLWIEEGVAETGEGIGRVLSLPAAGSATGQGSRSASASAAPVLHRIRRQSISSCPCLVGLPHQTDQPEATSAPDEQLRK
jgi:hypothetical protein